MIDEKKRLQRDSLEIIVCGFKDLPKDLLVSGGDERDHGTNLFFELTEHFLGQIVKHPAKFIGHIPWEFVVYDFSPLYKQSEKLPEDFFDKLFNIPTIHVQPYVRRSRRKTPNPEDVLRLLIQISPQDLEIDYNFNKRFYEQLTLIQTIEDLEVHDKYENLNWENFLKFEHLDRLSVFSDKLPIDFVARILRMKFLTSFSFYYSNFFFCFLKETNDQPVLRVLSKYKYKIDLSIVTNKGPRRSVDAFYFLNDLTKKLESMKTQNEAYLRGCLL